MHPVDFFFFPSPFFFLFSPSSVESIQGVFIKKLYNIIRQLTLIKYRSFTHLLSRWVSYTFL